MILVVPWRKTCKKLSPKRPHGSNWLFLRLCGTIVQIERTDYHIKEIDKILGILLEITR
jgi:hypothetical protein